MAYPQHRPPRSSEDSETDAATRGRAFWATADSVCDNVRFWTLETSGGAGNAATDAATHAATYDATYDAARAATRAATHAATIAAIRDILEET